MSPGHSECSWMLNGVCDPIETSVWNETPITNPDVCTRAEDVFPVDYIVMCVMIQTTSWCSSYSVCVPGVILQKVLLGSVCLVIRSSPAEP